MRTISKLCSKVAYNRLVYLKATFRAITWEQRSKNKQILRVHVYIFFLQTL